MRIRIASQLLGWGLATFGAISGSFKIIPFEDAILLILYGIAIEIFAFDN